MLSPAAQLRERIRAGVSLFRMDTNEETRAKLSLEEVAWQMTSPKTVEVPVALRKELMGYVELKDILPHKTNSVVLDASKIAPLLPRLSEESQIELRKLFSKHCGQVVYWDLVRGFSTSENSEAEDSCSGLLDRALETLVTGKSWPNTSILFVFKDCHPFLKVDSEQHACRRWVRDIAENELLSANTEHRRALVFTQPAWTPHPDISHYMVSIDFPLPDQTAIEHQIGYIEQSLMSANSDNCVKQCPTDLRHRLRNTLKGLTAYEIANILGYGVRAVSKDGKRGFSEETLKVVQTEKAKAFANEQCLSWIDTDSLASFDRFGGFENYVDWIDEVAEAYESGAASHGLKPAKGVLLIGVPGSGKSVVAMATAKRMKLPLLKFDFSAVLGQYVGQSEQNMKNALDRISAEGECVLLIDEADKAFSNVGSANSGNNVEQRVFGQLLSWMANDNNGTFVVMTMNRMDGVPIESIRAGRLSAIFYTDLPTSNERGNIFTLKLEDAGLDMKEFSKDLLEQLVESTADFVGAEIEQVVQRAMWTAWKARKNKQPTGLELLAACEKVKPAAKLDEAGVEKIRGWCVGKAEPVSKERLTSKKAGHARRNIKT